MIIKRVSDGVIRRRWPKHLLAGASMAAISMAMLQAGFSDYSSENFLNSVTGNRPPVFPSSGVWLALFTTAPTSDAGTGGTEVSGTNYARVQVAGEVAATASWTTSTPNITMTSNPGWVTPGMNVYDITNSQQIGTVLTYVGTSLVLTANAAHASSGSTDTLDFSAFAPAVGSANNPEPNTTPASAATTNATITFATAGSNWGTVTSFGLYDGLTGGNLLGWDYVGSNKWIPFTCTNASPGVMTADTAADAPANGSSIVVTQKYGGTLPPTGGSWAGLLTTAGLSGATFNAGVSTTGIGGGQFRQVSVQSIPNNVTASFASGTLSITLA
jgi:hypothetical protein